MMKRLKWSDEKIIKKLICNKITKTYWENIRELRKRASKDLFEICVSLINSQNDKERKIGIDILAQLSNNYKIRPFRKEVIKIYFRLLNLEKNLNNLVAILYGIGHNQESITQNKQIEIITSFKSYEEYKIREALTFALTGLKNKIAIKTLIFLTKDKKSYIRDWATFAIGTRLEIDTDEIRECLWKRVHDKHQDTKLEAIFGLAKRKDENIKKVIQNELKEKECGTLLFDAIEELNDKVFLPMLELLLQESENDKTINSEWIKRLHDCIKKLKQD